ncbi:hypothetical protein TCON_0465 [Astathelohania contejeani]|uniref:60S acidic ribosomal protein P2 n=1 Tax=Astathelohania contejeani TaxID=164912 RepID=A0ABQ7I1R1_9MICR|nr:hypothetical protein TCON_0465 [Thelohania contejeani]
MSQELINELYPLSALFIHACGLEVTAASMEKLITTLGISYQPRLGRLFEMDASKYDSMVENIGQGPAVCAVATGQPGVSETAEQAKGEEQVQEDDVELEFDDLFG